MVPAKFLWNIKLTRPSSRRLRNEQQVSSGRMDHLQTDDAAPSGSNSSSFERTPQQLIDQLTQLLGVLQRAHGVLPGYSELAAQQREAEQHAQHVPGTGQLAGQEQRDKWVAQELLVTQLTQQLSAYAEALDQLHGICQQQELHIGAAETHALNLQQQLVEKNKRIQELETDSLYRDGRIQDLEARVVKYRRLCSYVTANSQELERQERPHEGSPSRASAAMRSFGTADTVTQGSSGTGSASVMMAVTGAETVKRSSQQLQGLSVPSGSNEPEEGLETARRQHVMSVNAPDAGMQELKNTPWLKRMPCLIISRHPQLPREVLVMCKQITGNLLLGEVRQELKVRVNIHGSPIMSPSEFEAQAGCSKGKNWKANIRVLGKNGSTQMLKMWLPGLMQLVGDHTKIAIADQDISSLLDADSGLRIQPDA